MCASWCVFSSWLIAESSVCFVIQYQPEWKTFDSSLSLSLSQSGVMWGLLEVFSSSSSSWCFSFSLPTDGIRTGELKFSSVQITLVFLSSPFFPPSGKHIRLLEKFFSTFHHCIQLLLGMQFESPQLEIIRSGNGDYSVFWLRLISTVR